MLSNFVLGLGGCQTQVHGCSLVSQARLVRGSCFRGTEIPTVNKATHTHCFVPVVPSSSFTFPSHESSFSRLSLRSLVPDLFPIFEFAKCWFWMFRGSKFGVCKFWRLMKAFGSEKFPTPQHLTNFGIWMSGGPKSLDFANFWTCFFLGCKYSPVCFGVSQLS